MSLGRGSCALLLAAAALAAAQPAGASRNGTSPADQAKAQQVVLKRGDLPAVGNWTPEQPLDADLRCPGYDPKTSDLVTTGTATSEFSLQGLDIRNDVTVLSNERMAMLDWKRTTAGGVASCLGESFRKATGGKLQIVSARKIAAPAVGARSAAYRVVFDLKVKGKPMRGVVDLIMLSGGRTKVTFLLVAAIGPVSEQKKGEAGLTAIASFLAQAVGGRVFAPTA